MPSLSHFPAGPSLGLGAAEPVRLPLNCAGCWEKRPQPPAFPDPWCKQSNYLPWEQSQSLFMIESQSWVTIFIRLFLLLWVFFVFPPMCFPTSHPIQWTWIWANSGKQWRTEEPGVLQTMGLQRVGHDLTTEQHIQPTIGAYYTNIWKIHKNKTGKA